MRKFGPAAALAMAVCLVGAAVFAAQTKTSGKVPDSVKRGQALYAAHCVSCHGQTGEGDGPAASSLKVPPTNLTKISQRYKGFPVAKMADFISGEKYAVGHGSREMPVWGKKFSASPGGAAAEIDALTKYLESIQRK